MKKPKKLNYLSWPNTGNPSLATALRAAIAAGGMLHKAFYSDYEHHVNEDKSDFTPFDEQAELIASAIIREAEGSVAIMGEEISPDEDVSEKNFWVIDGIDGTTNFSRRIPICNFTLTKIVNGESIAGVVFDFLHGNLFYATAGGGAFLNGRKIYVKNRPFQESLIEFAPLLAVRRNRDRAEKSVASATWAGMKEISEKSDRFNREIQSGGLTLAWVTAGQLDGYASSWTCPWDLSAGVLLVQEAGGLATNIKGESWNPSYQGVIAGSPPIHKEMIAILQKHFNHFLSADAP